MNSKPTRVAGIVINDDKLLVIHRIREGREYYVFPGGGVEKGETNIGALLREIKEETSIKVNIDRRLYIHDYGSSQQFYYLCNYLSGRPKLASGSVEEKRMSNQENFYQPLWIDLDHLSQLLLYPLEIRDWLITDLEKGFPSKQRKAKLKISDLKQTLVE